MFEQLRDIHLPTPISWWPPAPGWWFLAGLLLVLIGLATWLLRLRRGERWRRAAFHELTQLRCLHQAGTLNAHDTVRRLSILVRRVALTRFPRVEVASLHGEEWLAFLDRGFNDAADQPFQQGVGRALATVPYMATTRIEAEELLKLTERWFKALGNRQ
ncbi:DUF4381 domain-containing protein [Gammaproteobacteria bacterium]